ncbi:5'-3' exonuclease PLD3 [Boleophthalmus pectinirostris]|uniref:5'-3' exonuclease PLD3 n=1 Tax=Boleophthalmus pectinirostris TaxID=150288 RepID=UPI00242AE513|nr:5'-3' exonuclease PLD3 [Boleophthalmus pectinirostris]
MEKDEDGPETEAPAQTEKTELPNAQRTKKRSSCCALLSRCLVPLLVLFFGGLSQHLWLYGLPRSVAQLSAQMHLHWLQGLVPQTAPCSSDCRASLVESLPVGVYPSAPAARQTIAQSWLRLLDRANRSVDVAAFYLTLRSRDGDPTDAQGRSVFEALKKLKSKGVSLRFALNAPQTQTDDAQELQEEGAEVKEVHLSDLTGGIIHTKLWTVDQRDLYVGSANMDWRSLTQVKEVGVSVEDCSCLAEDASRVFDAYWSVGGADGSLPPYWPARLSALSSSHNPLHLKFNGVPARVYLSSAPPQLSTRGRTDDLEAILSVMDDARQFIHVSVMDFLPQDQFSKPPRFWPPLDSSLRSAACVRRLKVRLLVSCWPHSPAAMFVYLQSLLVLNRPPLNCDIQVKVFTIPSTPDQMKIPYARVNHAKFMVTDRVLYIGTSNWSEGYFTQTAGVGLVVNQTGSEPGLETLRTQADQIFLRDWTSQYSTDLTLDQTDACPLAQS